MIKITNFILKYKITLAVCVLTIAFGFGWWVLANPGTTSIGENITVGNDLTVTGTSTFSGDVGIGTTSPGAKLEVNGNIIASTPTANSHVATKGYVDDNAGGSLSCTTTSSSAATNDISVSCPEGYTVTGGGCYTGFSDRDFRGGFPDGNGWRCLWGSGVGTKYVYARCCTIN